MPMLDVDGVRLAYDDVGRRDGVPLVFIHGWTANRHRWDDQLGHFAGRYRVISLDLRGHGDSDLTPDLYTIGGWPVRFSRCSTGPACTGSSPSGTQWEG